MDFYKKNVVLENPYPVIDAGKYPVKRVLGETFDVFIDAYKDGHDAYTVNLKYRHYKEKTWKRLPMVDSGDHRFRGSITLKKLGKYEISFEAFPDKHPTLITEYDYPLEVVVDPVIAAYASWYTMFPRSQGTVPGKSATFDDMIERLPDIEAMGFDVVYLTPIHPIGETNQKGPNNSLVKKPEDPGCPYSIGNKKGGHKAIEPSLGTMEDFKRFITACEKRGMKVAIDIAIQCSPDHPYIKQHPDWFLYEPDGTIKYAENPPKKYEDIVPLWFYPEKNPEALWDEITSIFLHWIDQGVTIFRVDNPHTKPLFFWEYCIRKVKDKCPEAIFLSEAFTFPKRMKILAKMGFTQSYTYFTWRNTKEELRSYLQELTQTDMVEYYRPNFFTCTPDILPEYLQKGGRNAFKVRTVLAATLVPLYGIYNGFELCENAAMPGKEEYIHSEKYQFKVWDWNRPGNIKPFIRAVNKIRHDNPALHELKNLHFIDTQNDQVLAYYKMSNDKTNVIMVIVNLDPYNTQESFVQVPHHAFGIGASENYTVTDLLSGQTFIWRGAQNFVKLDPYIEPAHIFKVTKWKHYEEDYQKSVEKI